MRYLMIENPGVAPTEGFTLLGASTKRDNPNAIGRFGSGNKYGISVCLRNNLVPYIFCGNLRMEFYTEPQDVGGKTFNRVKVKYSGKDENGNTKSNKEDLGYVLEYGTHDWNSVPMGLREFVSNSLDAAMEQCGPHERYWDLVKIQVVEQNQVRAKSGTTRIFVPYDDSVEFFHQNIGKWFLHFREPENLNNTILTKNNRNITANGGTVIYRRGVYVRELSEQSIFDYNIPNLEVDESRNANDYVVKAYAAMEIGKCDNHNIIKTFFSMLNRNYYFETSFSSVYLLRHCRETNRNMFKTAFAELYGKRGVACVSAKENILKHKGFDPVVFSEEQYRFVTFIGIPNTDSVLSDLEKDGISETETENDAQAAVDHVWEFLEAYEMTNNKKKPTVKCFEKMMNGEAKVLGFWKRGGSDVYINKCIVSKGIAKTLGVQALPATLMAVALEEVGHYVTEAEDNSRDFQEFFINFSSKLMM